MKNWSLATKIWCVLGVLSVAFVGNTYFSLSKMAHLRDDMNEITSVIMQRDGFIGDIKINHRQIMVRTLEATVYSDPEKLKQIAKELEELNDEKKKLYESYKAIGSETGKAIFAKYEAEANEFYVDIHKSNELALANKDEESVALFIETRAKHSKPMAGYLDELSDTNEANMNKKVTDANDQAAQALWLGIVVSSVSIISSILIAFFVLRAITSAIGKVVKSLSDSSAQVSSAASQIASASEELSSASTEQAAALEQTAASIEEMNSMVSKTTDNAQSASKTSEVSQSKATQGREVVEKMIGSMGEINQSNNTIMEQINRSNESMTGIVKVIEEIGNKTKVINDIVFQTKLLSFNASVEAARAGEHGKGFAVVAEEVGNLAQMSGNAAQEIRSLLEDSIQKVNQIVDDTKSSVGKLIEDGRHAVDGGTQVANQCGEVLQEIVDNVSSVSNMAGEIASASQEQSRGVSEITKAMNQLDQMTQQNAATSEECASAAEELSAQAESLQTAVQDLVSAVSGANAKGFASEKPVKKAQVSKSTAAFAKKPAAKESSNVIHLKGQTKDKPKAKPVADSAPMKKAVGDAPDYNDSGFDDV